MNTTYRDQHHQDQVDQAPDTAPGPVALAIAERIKELRGGRSFRAFAAGIGRVSSGHLCEVEQGKAKPSLALLSRIDERCATGGELGARYPELVAEWEAKNEERAVRRRELAQREEQREVRPVIGRRDIAVSRTDETKYAQGQYPDDTAPPRVPIPGGAMIGEDETKRREAIKKGLGAVLVVASGRARAFLRWVESPNVGPLTLERFDDVAQWLGENAAVEPVSRLFLVADQQFAEVAGLLQEGRHSSGQRQQLELLAGEFAYCQGRFAFMLGDHVTAQDHLRIARHFGEQLDHHLLVASAAICESGIAFYQGRLPKALNAILEAQQYATPYTAARIHANIARIYGSMGANFRNEMQAALELAERSLLDRPTAEPGMESPFGADLLAFYTSTAYMRVGHEQAEHASRNAIQQFEIVGGDQPNYEDLALARLNLAIALAQSKRPDPREAVRVAIQALAVPRQFQTDTVRRRAQEVLRLVASKWPSLPVVKELAEVVRGYHPPSLPAPPFRPKLTAPPER